MWTKISFKDELKKIDHLIKLVSEYETQNKSLQERLIKKLRKLKDELIKIEKMQAARDTLELHRNKADKLREEITILINKLEGTGDK